MSQPQIDPKELIPAGMGVLLGLGLLAFMIALAAVLGLPMSVNFGIPYQ